jgi:NADH-quinone oxidoreductase subunit L
MQALQVLFPRNDCTLLAFIVVLPLIGAVINGVFGKRLGREAVTLAGLSTVFASFLLSVGAFALLVSFEGEGAVRLYWRGWEWMTMSSRGGNSFPIEVALSVDQLNATMALVVTGVGFLIHLYSSKYMEADPGFYRFFAYLNLFIFSMLVLILGDNLAVLFVGWEGVGLCSYLLIGFWFEEEKNAAAGKKAFITNRIGDFGLLCAMGLLVYYVGALDWTGIEGGAQNLLQTIEVWPPRILEIAFPDASPTGLMAPVSVTAATLICLALFLGAAGKSAQIPLYVWLPDAMAGPTPVSALIHAATMVTAGVYLVCRMSAVFVLSPAAMLVVAITGALTAVFAATIAFAQNDIKKVLAYSTVSQLGYMFLGVGVGAFTAGFFHVVTHAFFKACMFLGAGSVIHAMHARIHDTDQSQDMTFMGGLRRYMPYTFWTFAFAWAAIIGIPGTSGFFSKDEILIKAFSNSIVTPGLAGGEQAFAWPTWAGPLLYGLGLAGAVMTAFYMTRLFIRTFFGEFRGWKIVKHFHGHGHEDHGPHDPSNHHHEKPGADHMEGPKPHESPWQMWLPLAILGGLSLVAGLLNAHLLHWVAFDEWLAPVFEKSSKFVQVAHHGEGLFIALAIAATTVGAGGAYYVYVQQQGEPARQFATSAPGFYALVRDKWRVDELYQATVIGAVETLAEISVWLDRWIVDGIIARLSAAIIAGVGTLLRFVHTGRVQAYAAVMVVGMGGLGWFFLMPRAEAKTVENHATGAYSVSATPGLGYSYRWDANGDGKWDAERFGDRSEVSFNLNVDQTRKVVLEVKNAFGRVAEKEFTFQRPKPDKSGATGPMVIDVERDEKGQLRGQPRKPPAERPARPQGQLPAGHPEVRP